MINAIKILVVDDRPINREALSLLLNEHNYEVLEAENGLQAIELLNKFPIHLVITDIKMPQMDGLSLVKALQSDPRLSAIPVVFYSATYKAVEAYRLAQASNVKYVLTKPCEPDIILNTIKNALGSTAVLNDPKQGKLDDINLRLTNLIEIGLDMSLEYDLEKLIYIVCKGGRQFLNACYGGIVVQDLENPNQFINYFTSKDNALNTFSFLSQELPLALEEIFIQDKIICTHSPVVEVDKIGLENIKLPFSSLLSLPLKTPRAKYGKLYFITTFNQKIFTPSDQRFMLTLADKFVINYENLILYKEVEKHAKKLEEEIIQRKKTEAIQIQTAEKLRLYSEKMSEVVRANSLGEVASSLAHELNQPLAAITAFVKGCIHRTKMNKEITPEIIEILNETALQAERAGEVVHRIKSFLRKGELFYEAVDINVLIEETIHIVQQEAKRYAIKIIYKRNKKLATVEVDKIQIQQVILNLLRNAMEAIQESKPADPQVLIEVNSQKNNHIVVKIKDNGPGFSEQTAKQLFDLYFTTKANGMGLGLAICRSIIEAHSGQLSGSVLPQGGSCFQFDLPAKTLKNKGRVIELFPLNHSKILTT